MTTNTLRHYQVVPDYRISISSSSLMSPKNSPERSQAIQLAARAWFNKRKFRQRTRQFMDFVRLPRYVTLKYKLR